MGVILGADGGNTRTDLVAATVDGEQLALDAAGASEAAKARLREELRAG